MTFNYVRYSILVIIVSLLALLSVLSLSSFWKRPLSEKTTSLLTRLAMTLAFCSSAAALVFFLMGQHPSQIVSFGDWFSDGVHGFSIDFIVDRYSLGFVTLTMGICGVVAAFSAKYLHYEPGFSRYFIQFSLFALGMTLIALAGSAEILFVGWEFVGLSSALLVGYFHERVTPVKNALRVFAVYRISDVALFGAVVLLHHWTGNGRLSFVFLEVPEASLQITSGQTALISALMIAAVAGKSALLPFSGWLARAMEGPTPSSAVYYGALSVHAGCYLLLRAEPFISRSPIVLIVLGLIALLTAIYANMVARVQTDVKSSLAYSSLTQVAIIIIEIVLGFKALAFIHMTGHICFRLLQFLSAPNILHDLHELENRVGRPNKRNIEPQIQPSWLEIRTYLFVSERGFIDSLIDLYFIRPFLFLAAFMNRFDRILTGSKDNSILNLIESKGRK